MRTVSHFEKSFRLMDARLTRRGARSSAARALPADDGYHGASLMLASGTRTKLGYNLHRRLLLRAGDPSVRDPNA